MCDKAVFADSARWRQEKPKLQESSWLTPRFIAALREYIRYVQNHVDQMDGGVWECLTHQICLGDEEFVALFRKERLFDGVNETSEISLPQRQVLHKTLPEFQSDYQSRDEAMARAYLSRAFTMKEIGIFFSVHYMTVSRAVKMFESSCEV